MEVPRHVDPCYVVWRVLGLWMEQTTFTYGG